MRGHAELGLQVRPAYGHELAPAETLERPAISERPWVAQYDSGVPTTLDYPAVRLDGLLRRTAEQCPDRAALIFFGRSTSYRALDESVDRAAAGLQRLGLGTGERVALFMPNCPQLLIGFYAVWRAGCVAVPINPRAAGNEVSRQLADSGAAAAVVLDRLSLALEDAALPATLRHLIVAHLKDDLPVRMRIAAAITRRGARVERFAAGTPAIVAFRDLVRGPADTLTSPFSDQEAAVLLYTGGTTGLPKAAVLTHRNLVANACQLGSWAVNLDDGEEVMLSALPLAHGYALTTCMNASVLRRWTQVLVPDPRDVDRLLREIERWRVTAFPGVPTLYASLSSHPDVRAGRASLRSIEACISGAAALPSGVQGEFERLTSGRLVEGYGLTEASPATHCNPLVGGGRSGTIGLPLPDTECRLVDIETETKVVQPGQAGVLCIRGPQVMAGYWRRPEDTSRVLRRDDTGRAWLHTGDVAEMSADGYFRIVDRKKDIIVAAGGLKVYPNEVEDVLSQHPKVRLSAVIGVPVGGTDQRAKAFVVLRQAERADADEILGFLQSRLAPYKVPKTIEIRSELPLAFTGKVLRRVLTEEERAKETACADVSRVARSYDCRKGDKSVKMSQHGGDEVVPYPKGRRFLEAAMRSTRHKPMIHGLLEVDVTRARARLREHQARTGETLSFTAFVIACLARAVDENKAVQAFRKGRKHVILFRDVDMLTYVEREVAGQPMILPYIVRAANRKTYRQIHEEIRLAQVQDLGKAVVGGAKAIQVLPAWLFDPYFWVTSWIGRRYPRQWKKTWGTVTISAVGMFGRGAGWGITASSPSLTWITVGGIGQKREEADGQTAIREYLSLTVSFDHNMIDGGPAARFTERLKELLEIGYGLVDDETSAPLDRQKPELQPVG
jgi:long-chain acyl-CoA synthetase